MISLKNLKFFWRTLQMPLIHCEIDVFLKWSSTYFITNSTGVRKFAISDAKLYDSAVTLSTQDNAKLLPQIKSGFRKTINWNKYQSKISTESQNQYVAFLINSNFKGEK